MSERIADTLQRATMMLGAAGIESPERDARILLCHILDIEQAELNARMNETLPPSAVFGMDRVLAVRSLHQPVSHIIGKRSFWNHEFLVSSDVLDPRPDTETLVAAALEQPFERVLDLGTGSGAIILSLLAEAPNASGVASDISGPALDIARRNAGRIGVAERVRFVESDWYDSLTGTFDLVVSNPPYISEAEMEALAPEVRDWEPHLALTPGGDGLSAYRSLAAGLSGVLSAGGRAFFEIGHAQALAVKQIFADSGYKQLEVLQDIDGRDRVIAINGK